MSSYLIYENILNPMLMVSILMYVSSFFLVGGFDEWFMVWLGLEINMMSFLVLVYNAGNLLVSEAMGKYFFVQSLASGGLVGLLYFGWGGMVWSMLLSLKMGVGPFYFWYVSVVGGLTWGGNFVLMTLQKVLPVYLMAEVGHMVLWGVGVVSLIVGVVGVFNQVLVKSVMAYSSVHHGGWLVLSVFMGDYLWVNYFMLYFVMMSTVLSLFCGLSTLELSSHLSKRGSVGVVVAVLNLGGVPPLVGFLLKWVSFLWFLGMDYFLCFTMMVVAAAMLYVYLRLIYDVVLGGEGSMGWVVAAATTTGLTEIVGLVSGLMMGLVFLLI